MSKRSQSVGEERANSIIHGAALLGSLAAFPVLLFAAAAQGDRWQIVSGAIFGATLILLYLSSTLYHAWPPGPAKRGLRVLDHSAIYLLIAGTYTPFMLGALRGPLGWSLLIIIWSLALLGILAKCTIGFRLPRLSTVLYLAALALALILPALSMVLLAVVALTWVIPDRRFARTAER